MVAALLIRRKQMLLLGYADPFKAPGTRMGDRMAATALPGGPSTAVAKSVEAATQQQAQTTALLRILKAVTDIFPRDMSQSIMGALMTQPVLLDNLRKASAGDFGIIMQLTGLLDFGLADKTTVDIAVDAAAQVTNLREAVVLGRVQYAVKTSRSSAGDDDTETARIVLMKALRSLERYYFLVAFASYVNASQTAVFGHRFSVWLQNRAEIWSGIKRIRSRSMPLWVFDPVADLSVLSAAISGQPLTIPQVLESGDAEHRIGDEFAQHVVRNRAGIVLRAHTILKRDVWNKFAEAAALAGLAVPGTVNFAQVEHMDVYATGQPTLEGIRNALLTVWRRSVQPPKRITWLNLREEPLVYINGKPYCLRPSEVSLRNIKSFSGISWSRLQLLEERLKADVLSELQAGEGSILLHTETADGQVVPAWVEAEPKDVQTVAEVMVAQASDMTELATGLDAGHSPIEDEAAASLTSSSPLAANTGASSTNSPSASEGDEVAPTKLAFRRIPITSERMPDATDMDDLLVNIFHARVGSSPIIVNDQLGRGRSTLTSIIVSMVSDWVDGADILEEDASVPEITGGQAPRNPLPGRDDSATPSSGRGPRNRPPTPADKRQPLQYRIINSLLRVLPHGMKVKHRVDAAIDRCSSILNLREAIEDDRFAAAETTDAGVRAARIASGIAGLKRYFGLMILQAYLMSTDSKLPLQPTYEKFVARQPVIETISQDFDRRSLDTITPLPTKAGAYMRSDKTGGPAGTVSKSTTEEEENQSVDLTENEEQEVISARSGDILTPFTLLKADFFPGILKHNLHLRIEGMPNLRQEPLLLLPVGSLSASVNLQAVAERAVWGTGMPSVEGLRAGLQTMGVHPHSKDRYSYAHARSAAHHHHRRQSSSGLITGGPTSGAETPVHGVVWTSLREEPVLYVKGRPHVLRLADQPLTNVEATGISTEVVERMERALKRDVIIESRARGNRVLLHDEVGLASGRYEVIPLWAQIDNEDTDIQTPREVYAQAAAEGYAVDYARIAVTDEQAPRATTFSLIEARVHLALQRGWMSAWNCQMGRGRTTTGMIIAALVATVAVCGDDLLSGAQAIFDDSSSMASESNLSMSDGEEDGLAQSQERRLRAGRVKTLTQADVAQSGWAATAKLTRGAEQGGRKANAEERAAGDGGGDGGDDDEDDESYLRAGEYRCILQLVSVLQHGRLAKRLADAAIDQMATVQNLRTATSDALQRAREHPGLRRLRIVFTQYLQRYGYIVAFAGYLLEKAAAISSVHEAEARQDAFSLTLSQSLQSIEENGFAGVAGAGAGAGTEADAGAGIEGVSAASGQSSFSLGTSSGDAAGESAGAGAGAGAAVGAGWDEENSSSAAPESMIYRGSSVERHAKSSSYPSFVKWLGKRPEIIRILDDDAGEEGSGYDALRP